MFFHSFVLPHFLSFFMFLLKSFSHARHFTSTTTVARILFSREYRDLLSCVTFLLLQCQLRETCGEINPLIQFSVFVLDFRVFGFLYDAAEGWLDEAASAVVESGEAVPQRRETRRST